MAEDATTANEFQLTSSLKQGIKLAVSLVLFYWVTLATNQDLLKYGALAIVICSLETRGATLQKGLARIVGTTFGAIIGLTMVGIFNTDPWLTVIALSGYLILVAYGMQGSRYSYAWYLAAFLPLVIWADTFPDFSNGFEFAVNRWLETTLGVLIYSIVDRLLWPQYAGVEFARQGKVVWTQASHLFQSMCHTVHLETSNSRDEPEETPGEMAVNLAGARSKLALLMEQAQLDTLSLKRYSREWNHWQASTHELLDALLCYQSTLSDVKRVDLASVVPEILPVVQRIQRRLDWLAEHWSESQVTIPPTLKEGDPLLELGVQLLPRIDESSVENNVEVKSNPETQRASRAPLSPVDRLGVNQFLTQLGAIDRASLAAVQQVPPDAMQQPQKRAENEVPQPFAPLQLRARKTQYWSFAVYPAVVFLVAALIWACFNPPTGPAIPMFAGILSLVIVRTPMPPLQLIKLTIASIVFVVAPIYWLVMPQLSTSFELFSLVFIMATFFGFLGGTNPALKAGPMLIFVTSAGVANQQAYSFAAMVNGGLMQIIAGSVVVVMYALFVNLHPEANLARKLGRFFAGCSRFTESLAGLVRTGEKSNRAARQLILEAEILPGIQQVRTAIGMMERSKSSPEQSKALSKLLDSVSELCDRFRLLEAAARQIENTTVVNQALIAEIEQSVRECLEAIFEEWSHQRTTATVDQSFRQLDDLKGELRNYLDALPAPLSKAAQDQQAELGYVAAYRGLVDAVRSTRGAMQNIDWVALTRSQFS